MAVDENQQPLSFLKIQLIGEFKTLTLRKMGVDVNTFAEPFKEELRCNAEQIAKDNEIEIEFVSKSHIRKEDLAK